MIKEIICVDIGKTIYVVSTDKDKYYYISTKQRKIVKGCLAELTKVGYWLENEDHSDYLLKLLEDILKYPDIVIDNRKAGTLQGYVIRNQYDLSPEEAKELASKLNEDFK